MNQVTQRLLTSARWEAELEGVSVLAVALTEPLKPERWTDSERRLALAWADNESDVMPAPMRAYLQKVRT